MIRVINDWYITIETNPVNYVVRCGKGEKDARSGWKDKAVGFFGSLRKAVAFIREQNYRGGLKNRLPHTCGSIADGF